MRFDSSNSIVSDKLDAAKNQNRKCFRFYTINNLGIIVLAREGLGHLVRSSSQ